MPMFHLHLAYFICVNYCSTCTQRWFKMWLHCLYWLFMKAWFLACVETFPDILNTLFLYFAKQQLKKKLFPNLKEILDKHQYWTSMEGGIGRRWDHKRREVKMRKFNFTKLSRTGAASMSLWNACFHKLELQLSPTDMIYLRVSGGMQHIIQYLTLIKQQVPHIPVNRAALLTVLRPCTPMTCSPWDRRRNASQPSWVTHQRIQIGNVFSPPPGVFSGTPTRSTRPRHGDGEIYIPVTADQRVPIES